MQKRDVQLWSYGPERSRELVKEDKTPDIVMIVICIALGIRQPFAMRKAVRRKPSFVCVDVYVIKSLSCMKLRVISKVDRETISSMKDARKHSTRARSHRDENRSHERERQCRNPSSEESTKSLIGASARRCDN